MRHRVEDHGSVAPLAATPAAARSRAQAARPNAPLGASATQHDQRGAFSVPSVLQEET
jgi:hypothetical protein